MGLFLSQASLASADAFFTKGAMEWGVSAGVGSNFDLSENVSEDIQFYYITPSIGRVMKRWEEGDSIQLNLEGFFSYVRQVSKDRFAVGLTPLLVYNFKQMDKAVPFVEAGAGFLVTDLDPDGVGSTFNSTLQGGVGLRHQ